MATGTGKHSRVAGPWGNTDNLDFGALFAW
jgi:hypothetical protein